jgi:hypothetical protein
MKIAVTDACIFIDLYDLQLTAQFFSLNIEVHTSIDVIKELYENQQQYGKKINSLVEIVIKIVIQANADFNFFNYSKNRISSSVSSIATD